ncbi:GNAT family N-acetyltransferase [Lactobacillus sp. YT155]|uniref:GNAT family N-acetyltransferase n=1 Tax=Lactobacillus sp. YT155 TaxID=3060955 RepID=UPI00265FCB3D|nr:GNAT family N-acetyltransferase [Lactobacillus sp. YT155]MDO1604605.1 GNAT family N-acetyltransferase [Lactobacillus sp. YT155]
MIITNKQLTKNDFEQITKIWLDSNLEVHNFIKKSYWLRNVNYVKQALLKAEILAYKVEDEILGFTGVKEEYIEGLFVADSQRGKGIGSELLAELKNQHDTLKLFVYKKNQKAVNFYLAKDFQIFSEELEEETGELNISMFWKK